MVKLLNYSRKTITRFVSQLCNLMGVRHGVETGGAARPQAGLGGVGTRSVPGLPVVFI